MAIDYNKLVSIYGNKDKGYEYLGRGCSREVYLCPNKTTVVKIPLSDYHARANEREVSNYRASLSNPGGVQVAKCSLRDSAHGPVVLMERVEPLMTVDMFWSLQNEPEGLDLWFKANAMPGWIRTLDCWQVGKTLDGRIVAYDVGDKVL